MRLWIALALCAPICAFSGCGTVIEPGHRGLLFMTRGGGLKHDVLPPGYHRHGAYSRVLDFDVTYSTKTETLRTISSEGLALGVRLSVSYRPVVAELYDLVVEIGENYYDEVIGPQFRTATNGVFARHSYLEVQRNNTRLEQEVRDELRQRTVGKHVEISAVTMEEVSYAPEIAEAIRSKLVGEQEAIRKKVAQEAEAQRRKLELQQESERAKLESEGLLRAKQRERELTEEQGRIDKLRAEGQATTALIKAKADAEELSLRARARAEEQRANAATLTPLSVLYHAYDALAKLGGSGTTLLLGDFSHVPAFLLPPGSGLQSLFNNVRSSSPSH